MRICVIRCYRSFEDEVQSERPLNPSVLSAAFDYFQYCCAAETSCASSLRRCLFGHIIIILIVVNLSTITPLCFISLTHHAALD